MCAIHCSETASDLLFGFDGSNVSFRLVIGKRYDIVLGEGQNGVAVFKQSVQKCEGFSPDLSSAFFLFVAFGWGGYREEEFFYLDGFLT